MYELSDGSGVVLTVGKYVTPGHQDIDGAGIEPDYKQLPSNVLALLVVIFGCAMILCAFNFHSHNLLTEFKILAGLNAGIQKLGECKLLKTSSIPVSSQM